MPGNFLSCLCVYNIFKGTIYFKLNIAQIFVFKHKELYLFSNKKLYVVSLMIANLLNVFYDNTLS